MLRNDRSINMKLRYAVALVGAAVLNAQDIAGDWQGTLKPNGVELRLILHIVKSSTGALTATCDSVDQGANGIPIGPVTLEKQKVSFASASIGAKYEGKVNADASLIDGAWTQSESWPLVFKRAVKTEAKKPGPPSDIDGAWLGTLDVGGGKLRLVFHFVNMQDGLTATWDSPDQGVNGLPVSEVTRNGASLKLGLKQAGATFEGKIAPDHKSIAGTFTQGGQDFPLVLAPMK